MQQQQEQQQGKNRHNRHHINNSCGSDTLEQRVIIEPGRIHGCVGSYWELHPPIYEVGNIDGAHKNMQTINNNKYSSPTLRRKGGGLRLQGLDVYKTFRKGYSVLIWVRPTLVRPLSTPSSSSLNGCVNHEDVKEKQELPPRKQVLYRFATGLNDNSPSAVGVCALLGQWKALPIPLSTMSDSSSLLSGATTAPHWTNKDNNKKAVMLTTTLTAYTLPCNSDLVMSRLFPATDSVSIEEKEGESTTTTSNGSVGSSDGGISSNEENLDKIPKSRLRGSSGSKDSATTTTTTQQNTKRQSPQHHSHHPTVPSSSTINAPSSQSSTSSPSAAAALGGVITGNITLPANEWSLISIQHTHPYLRRSELIVSVNGDEMMRGELGFPVLDSASIGSGVGGGGVDEHFGDSASHDRGIGDKPAATTPDLQLDEHERQRLRGMGALAECTLLDGAFDNGVELFSNKASPPTVTPPTRNCCLCSCIASVHSMALLSGPPVPDPVLALLAERGPLGDCSSSSVDGKTGLSFVVGPVPTNPQNRDAIVALSAGHGYYGSNPDGGGGGSRGEGGGNGSGGGGIIGNPSGKGIHELTPPRSLGIPVSVGITPGVNPGGSGVSRGRTKGASGGNNVADETWIGGPGENEAHITLQGLLGRVSLTFHSADTKLYGGVVPPTSSPSSTAARKRIVCPPSTAPSRIGGADAVPKVGIVRPIPPCPPLTSAGLEITGNASYQNVTWNYICRERQRDRTLIIRPPLASPFSDHYCLEDNPPVSFPRAIQAANTMNISLLPFRLALPHAGNEEVNDVQRKIHIDSFRHLYDLLSNNGELASLLISLITECIRCGGSSARDEALQNGIIHVLGTMVRKVVIRGERLGLLGPRDKAVIASTTTNGVAESSRTNHGLKFEHTDYDMDNNSSCPLSIPSKIVGAMVGLIDACCGPAFGDLSITDLHHPDLAFVTNPYRGLLRVRRASDIALTALFGLAMDFDLIGNDASAAASVLNAIADRYCHVESAITDQVRAFFGEDYGLFLRKQLNFQYFLDCIRIRFDHSLASPSRQLAQWSGVITQEANEISAAVVASSLSSILYTMLLSTLTSSTGLSVSRGERDVGALVASLTECPLGSICAHVVTTAIARLLVKCGVLNSLCLGSSIVQHPINQKKRIDRRPRNHNDLALESRLGRNMLLCHYHDIVAPLLLSRSSPRFSLQPKASESRDSSHSSVDLDSAEDNYPLDWSHHWRLTLLTFAVRSVSILLHFLAILFHI